jgi:hypothetical protein
MAKKSTLSKTEIIDLSKTKSKVYDKITKAGIAGMRGPSLDYSAEKVIIWTIRNGIDTIFAHSREETSGEIHRRIKAFFDDLEKRRK